MEHRVRTKAADFANARDARNLFERVISMQANRVGRLTAVDDIELTTITAQDVSLALADEGYSGHRVAGGI